MAQLFSDNPAKSSIVVPDQLPCFVVSYLGFHALPKSVGLNARLKWVEVCWILDWFDVVEPKWAATWQNQESECAPSEDSDQPGHQPSLIRVFAVHLMCSYGPKLSSCGQRILWSDWVDAHADLSLRWAHTHCVGFVMSRLNPYLGQKNACFDIDLVLQY